MEGGRVKGVDGMDHSGPLLLQRQDKEPCTGCVDTFLSLEVGAGILANGSAVQEAVNSCLCHRLGGLSQKMIAWVGHVRVGTKGQACNATGHAASGQIGASSIIMMTGHGAVCLHVNAGNRKAGCTPTY
ncbi:hypothetical protein CCHR01_15952 [Colletotrichum chrysophilum]|uniref:Uncharacterized protein n=1 Tax=Colletotrichum chrysophilum TaxID=1836956 RepID=A0AAD9A6S9_9PEZI|nr:hypothetical protein CCHR01_15952 [Colletotrichum chrysophilum]